MNLHDFVKIATTAPSADNSQQWLFTAREGRISCSYFPRNEPDPFGPLGHGTVMSAGALHETVLRLVGEPAPANVSSAIDDSGWAISFPASLLDAIDESAVAAVRERHTNRLPFKQLGSRNLPDVGPCGNCRISTVSDPTRIRALAHSLRKCSEARFNDRALHEWLFSSIRWSEDEAATGTGLDIATLHLPPGGSTFMKWIAPWSRMAAFNRLGLYKLLALSDSALFRQAPAVVALSGPRDVNAVWDAGRTLQRVWLALNQAGIAVHPYYAVTDLGNRLRDGLLAPDWRATVDDAIRQADEALALNADEQIHMLLRVGLSTKRPVRSRRMPPEAFISGD